MESKKDIRKRILDVRASLSQHSRDIKNQAIIDKVVKHPFFLSADYVYCYVDYNSEVATGNLIKKAWESGKKVAVPKIEGDIMRFYIIHDFSDLAIGYRGILEPKTNVLAVDSNALVVMPGVAFDKNRHRVGYGKGYYDKFLNHHNGQTIALAYELQIVDSIPANRHDIFPDILITEDNIYESIASKWSNHIIKRD